MANKERRNRLQCDKPMIIQPTQQHRNVKVISGSCLVQNVQILIEGISRPWGEDVQQRYLEAFRDVNICRSLDVLKRVNLKDMNIDDEHQDDIMQGINQWLKNNKRENFESPLPGLTERMDNIKETEGSSNVLSASLKSFGKIARSTAWSVASEESIQRKRELILKANTERPIQLWQIKNFWRKRFGALKDCITVRKSEKHNEFILCFKDEESKRIAHKKGTKYKLDLKKHNETAEYNNLAKLTIEYKLSLNRGVRPSPKNPVKYRALRDQPITQGKATFTKIRDLKKGEVILINQVKSTRVRVCDPDDHEGKVNVGWVTLHTLKGENYLERID